MDLTLPLVLSRTGCCRPCCLVMCHFPLPSVPLHLCCPDTSQDSIENRRGAPCSVRKLKDLTLESPGASSRKGHPVAEPVSSVLLARPGQRGVWEVLAGGGPNLTRYAAQRMISPVLVIQHHNVWSSVCSGLAIYIYYFVCRYIFRLSLV